MKKEMKVCSKCKKSKSKDQFGWKKHRDRRDTILNKCKPCQKEYDKNMAEKRKLNMELHAPHEFCGISTKGLHMPWRTL